MRYIHPMGWCAVVLVLVVGSWVPGLANASDEGLQVRLGSDVRGIDQISRRCFIQLREAGHGPERMPADLMSECMRPEMEAMAEFAYEVTTAYPVSSLTRVALETCTLEQATAVAREIEGTKVSEPSRLTWRWLTDCLKEVRWLDHDEQTKRRDDARRAARRVDAKK